MATTNRDDRNRWALPRTAQEDPQRQGRGWDRSPGDARNLESAPGSRRDVASRGCWSPGQEGATEWGSEAPVRRGGMQGRGPSRYARADQRILEDICERLTEDDWVDATDVEVQVEGGEVTLSGTIADRPMKRRAEEVAESVTGVRDVHNQIKVMAPASRTPSNPLH